MLIMLCLACASGPQVGVRTPGAPPPSTLPIDTEAPAPADTAAAVDTGGPCPNGMALVESFCIDRFEAHLDGQSPYEVPTTGVAESAPGIVPQGYISGEVATAACVAAGKRLCTLDEWARACQGSDGWAYPYGDTYDAGACNVTRAEHPIISLFGSDADWSTSQMNDPAINQQPDTVDPSGANPGCVSREGVYDLHGNLHEWIADPAGTFKGGFYMDAVINGPGCSYVTTAHTLDYHDYSTGFRCCADL